ncbi:MAG: prolipoprotein diacylglyceryl transferase [Eubacteriaceae bacterium]|nr:prolipoprotein diacylglyceryl transferase [Eubacteriaceae bacterium]
MSKLLAFLGKPDPVAFEVFGYQIRWYAIMISLGIMAGFFVFLRRGKSKGFKEDDLYDIFLWIIPCAVLGARLYYVVFEWSYYSNHLSEILAIWKGGLAIHGAILFGASAALLVCRHKKINFFSVTDLLAPSLALGQAIGRWGNYFNMEAHGTTTDLPWAIEVIEGGKVLSVHPTFLYESLWNMAVCLILIFIVSKKAKYHGSVTCWYFILYSTGRFFIEALRTDSLYFMGMRTAQIVSVLLILLSSAFIIVQRKKGFFPMGEGEKKDKTDE